MFLNEIIAIDKKSGLFKVVAITGSGIVAESLLDGRRIPVSGNEASITILRRTDIYTLTGEVSGKLPLMTLFKQMHAHGSVPEKTTEDVAMKQFFTSVCPEHDGKR